MLSPRLKHSASADRIQLAPGFTLAELMIVVALIGVISALAIPAYQRLATRSRHTLFQNELRVASQALETYAMERGDWPPDGQGGWPEPIFEYLPPPNRWNQPTPLGGRWEWTRDAEGVKAALRVSGYQGGEARGLAIDRLIDDGNLTAGVFRGSPDRLLYVMQE